VNLNEHAWGPAVRVSAGPLASAATTVAARRALGGVLQLCDIVKVRRALFFVVVVIMTAGAFFGTSNAAAAEPKRVLLVHSFGSGTPPFTVESTAFETELVEKMGERVDLDEVSLDMARYADRDMQEAIVDYLQKRKTKWRPDLVVTIGSPAGIFAANYRDRLFPETPILYATLDRRLLPPGALDNSATYVGQTYEIRDLIDDMLQIAPATKNISVVIGATPLEHVWEKVFKEAAEPLAGRIKFTYYSDLTFEQMKQRVSTLPPDSYIFFLLLLRDAAGVTINADEALQRLHAVANAPMNSIFNHQLGLGIVGGRLHQSDRVGKAAAAVAIRILHGEPPSSMPPTLIEPLPPRYDWRELQRWKIDEKLLPPGTTILYREPTLWEQHRVLILSVIIVCGLQALLISGLLVNRMRRRRAELSLEESENRFQTMAHAAPIMIWVSGEDKRCTYLNKAWLEFTGRRMEQDLGDGWSEAIHPEDVEKTMQTYDGAFDSRAPFLMQYRLRRHDGEYRQVTDQGVPRYGPRGNFRGYVGACVDITDLLKKEAALREIEERVALAAEAAQLGAWELDTTTNSIWVSDKVCELFRLKPAEQVRYAEFQEHVHPQDRAGHDAAIEKAIETRGGYEMEFRVLLPDGTVRWLAERARCIGDQNGNARRLLGISIDATKRKEAEELFRLATEASPSGTLLVDAQGRIVLVNAHMEELFGYARDELVGQKVELLVPDRFAHDPVQRVSFLTAPQASAMGAGLELFGRRKNGSEFPVEIGLNPITTPRGTFVLATVIDISARKTAEEEARHRREQVDRLGRVSLLGEMTASLAHELNQPLSAIMSNANAAMQYIGKGKLDPAQLQDILTDVVADGRRAHDIIDNVRTAIKKGGALRGRLNLNDVVKAVTHLMYPDAAAQSCKLEMSLAEDLRTIEGDPTQMQQVVINLVRNAMDAMRDTPPDHRKVQIATNNNGNATVCVAVRDHGCGILETAGDRLFEQFFTTKEEGLGMGLAIVRSIIEAHGGRVAAGNADGGGARFYFHLPTSEAPQ
jgi:PAS domain S-box-containing protein